VRGCLVFCSVFYKVLHERGPAAVLAMTQSVNVFDYSTWVFFFCERSPWWCGVVHNVPGLARALRMSAAGVMAQTGHPAGTLAFFNSLGSAGVFKYSHVRTTLFGWVRTVALETMRDETGTPPARWVSTCSSVVSPSVPQQGATLDCGVSALSFFSSLFLSALWQSFVFWFARVQQGRPRGRPRLCLRPVRSCEPSATSWSNAKLKQLLAKRHLDRWSCRSGRQARAAQAPCAGHPPWRKSTATRPAPLLRPRPLEPGAPRL